MKDIETLKQLLSQAIEISNNNIYNMQNDYVTNFDLEDFAYNLESYLDDLEQIDDFEYSDEDEEDDY